MRKIGYPERGPRAPRAAQEWEEFVLLTQAAVTIANTERRVLDRDRPGALEGVAKDNSSRSAYEVTVVDKFYQLGQRAFERRQTTAVWERPYPTGNRGRPLATDVCLFTSPDLKKEGREMREVRIEFGLYTKKKLRDDSLKLHKLRNTRAEGYPDLVNLLILWEESDAKLTARTLKSRVDKMNKAANELTGEFAQEPNGDKGVHRLKFLMASGVDLFSEKVGEARTAYVGLFETS